MKPGYWAAVIVAGGTLWAQQKPTAPEREKPRPAQVTLPATASLAESELPAFSNYQVGPEDLLSITVQDAPEFTRQLRVSGSGTIKMPLIKRPIAAAGKTCPELEADITRALIDEGLLRDPSVSVTLRETHSKPVTISGAVLQPTVFQATRPMRLVEALSKAGGPTENAGPEVLVLVPAQDGEAAHVVRAPIRELLEKPASEHNRLLRGGEEIRVPVAGRVYLLGAVQRPGTVTAGGEEPLTVLKALALAGGPAQFASSKLVVLRPAPGGGPGQETAVDLKKLLKREVPDLTLQANDMIFIPESGRKKATQTSFAAAVSSAIYAGVGVLLWR